MKAILNFILIFIFTILVISLFATLAFATGSFIMWDIGVFLGLFDLSPIVYRVILVFVFILTSAMSLDDKCPKFIE